MRRQRLRAGSVVALGTAVLLAGGSGLALADPAAPRTEPFGSQSLSCRTLSTIGNWDAEHTITLDPANPGIGGTVNVTYEISNGGVSGPVPIAAGDLVPTAVLTLGGALGGTVEVAGPAYGAIGTHEAILGATMTGAFVAGAPGDATATVERIVFDHPLVVTTCDGGSDPVDAPAPTTMVFDFTVQDLPAAEVGSPSPSPSPSSSPSPAPSPSPSPSPSLALSPADDGSTEGDSSFADPGVPRTESFGPMSLSCRTLSTIVDWSAEHTVTLDPANPGMGGTVNVTYEISNGGVSGPVPIAAGDLVPTAVLRLGGSLSGTVEVRGPAYGAIGAYEAIPGATMTGAFVAGAPGDATATVERIVFDHPVVITTCDGGSDPVDAPAPTGIVFDFTVQDLPAADTGTGSGGNGTGENDPGTGSAGGTTDVRSASGTLPVTGSDPGMLAHASLWALAFGLWGIALIVAVPRVCAGRHR